MLLSGVPMGGVETLSGNLDMQALEVCRIARVALTEQAFVVNPVLDRRDPAYAQGIICLAA
jgi:hypothetical protein